MPLTQELSISRMSGKPLIRWAYPYEGPLIQSILQSQNVALADMADWTLPLGPYWLVAVLDEPVGCVMVNPGQPVGRMEWLTVIPTLGKKQYATTIRDLCYAGLNTLKSQGSQFVAGYVSDTYEGWKQIIENRGLEAHEAGTLYLGRL